MNRKITLKGVGFGVGFIELSDDELERFLTEIEEVDEASELKLVSDLMAESFYEYGLLLNEEELLLDVNGNDETNLLNQLISRTKSFEVDLTDSNNTNWLYYEAKENVSSTMTIESFDESKFDLIKHKIILPNKSIKEIVNIYYADKDFETGGTTSVGFVYIVKKDGEIITF